MPPTRLLLTVLVLAAGLALAPGAVAAEGDVSVTQADDGSATVTVTENDTAVAGATVTVETTDDSTYAGAGTYETDESGTVGLPAPEEPVDVAITATWDDTSVGVEGTLEPADDGETELPDAFGDLVSSFVHEAQDETENGTGIGPMVATYVLEHSPAADRIPDHAGPPEHVTNETAEPGPQFSPVDVGPPEHVANETGQPDDVGGGQPEDTGKPEDAGPK